MTDRPRLVLVANPENRRAESWQRALRSLGALPARVLPYEQVLAARVNWGDFARQHVLLRFESPGENFAVEKLLLAAGAELATDEGSPCITRPELAGLGEDPGLILYPRQWYLGWRAVLMQWQRDLSGGAARLLNQPVDIARMFDKRACHADCSRAGIPTAECCDPIHSFDELLEAMRQRAWERVFIKLAHGSSASGVVAFHRRGASMSAITSVELAWDGGQANLYNSLRVRRYAKRTEIQTIIDALCRQRVHVERWLPKPAIDHRTTFDLRIVVINGQPCQRVVRTSRGPITNLHLGNRRGDLAFVLDRLGPERTAMLDETCRRVAALYPRTACMGIDVVLSPNWTSHAVLEVNAFGDLLPGVLHEGRDTHLTQVESIFRSEAQPRTATRVTE
jgi:hypothetical protein